VLPGQASGEAWVTEFVQTASIFVRPPSKTMDEVPISQNQNLRKSIHNLNLQNSLNIGTTFDM